MKKYRCVVSYAGTISIEVEAGNENEAAQFAEDICDDMNDDIFLYELEPQHEETNVEEIVE